MYTREGFERQRAAKRFTHDRAVAVEGAVFLAYITVVVWRMSERVAAATGKCDSCGGQVIEESAPVPRQAAQ